VPITHKVWETPAGVGARFVLVRHGEPEASARGRCYGSLDVGLSDSGRGQIDVVARCLRQAPLAAVYTSPRRRARESAEIVARSHELSPSVDERLGEIDFGQLEGMSYDEAAEKYPELYRAWMEQPTEVTFPDGESFDMMERRVLSAAADMRSRHRGQVVAIVTHGGVNRVLLRDALGLPKASIFRLDQSYAALSLVDYYEHAPVVRFVNVELDRFDHRPEC